MKKILLVFLLASLLFAFQTKAFAQNPQAPKTDYFKAKVTQIENQGYQGSGENKIFYQTIKAQFEEGSQSGDSVEIKNSQSAQIGKPMVLKADDEVVISATTSQGGKTTYAVNDFYRINDILLFAIIFLTILVVIAGLKGAGSILGMALSLLIILFFIIPNILDNRDPLTITLIGSSFIILISTYLAHGISKKTTIALVSTLISLGLAALFSILAINFTKIYGLGNEDFYNLQLGSTRVINIQGLFLSAIIISTLGALNDITTTQAATILEFKKTDSRLDFVSLFEKGLIVGREHIASLVNTLILAYAGSSLGVFIFFVLNPAHTPAWVIFNNEVVADEVIRIIAGSTGLLLSVPIVTAIASYVFEKENFNSARK